MTVTAILPVPESFARRREAVFAPVAGQSTLVRIVRTLASVGDVVVCTAGSLVDEVRNALAALELLPVRVVAADAPGERKHCIDAGLRALADGPRGHVLLHDLAWPLVAPATLERVAAELRAGAVAVLPICPVTDSIKAVDARGVVTATVDRAQLRTVQYPRGFDAALLAQVISGTAADACDEVEAVLSGDVPVTLVEGDNDAMSVELPADAGYLAAIIADRGDRPDR
ncbi:4-diphosphocytidyl-2C-methyl-D-erythritol synthase [Mycolicibacterium aurum]|uniref:4-diphosphocytidyl-2C-methyl-D-erythritol synthase n=1 Tax=Mycolicibacterium aurum TaxID=1791 RepID=A0A448IWK8_MYCAU|nr:2-C-methyl-D-erythritol 4-phosphate cytidylyltransferase [Mycolicibacterium aurum]VEG56862.1 4-diphosphocytidyl-2C-methyl-D-erythritol synthase [Mycolicibacterium aurum]